MSGNFTSFPLQRPPLTALRRTQWGVLGFVVLISMAVTALLIGTRGNIATGYGLILGLGLLLITVYRIEWSLFILIGLVLMFDQYDIPGFEPLTFTAKYFVNLKEHPSLPSLDAGVANLIELHSALLLLVWAVVVASRGSKTMTPVPVYGSLLLLVGALGFAFVQGMRSEGDLLPALWEVRALVYFAFFYWFVPQIVRTREHIETLVWVFIVCVSFKALQGVARFAVLGFSFQGLPTLTNHEDPVFITTLLILLLGLYLFGVRNTQRMALLWLTPLLLAGFFTGQRRTAYAGMALSFVLFVVLLPRKERWALFRVVLPLMLVGAVYCAVFWESESKWASPVRLVKSGLSNEEEEAGDRYYSNLYREFENYNLAYTVRQAPVVGIGFGKQYYMPIPLADIPFPLRDYIAHNQILWFLAKTGAIGYFCFWLFFNTYAFRGALVLKKARDPYFKAICAVAVVAIVNQVVASYFDLQLTFYRNMIYLGSLLGLLAVVEELENPRMIREKERS